MGGKAMNCPNCGSDLERFLQEEAAKKAAVIEEEQRAREEEAENKRNEFNRLYGKKFRRLAWRNGLLGMVVLIFVFCLLLSLNDLKAGFRWPWDVWLGQSLIFRAVWAFLLVVYAAAGFFYGVAKALVKKDNFRKSLGVPL